MGSKIPAKTLSASSAAAWMERLRAKASSYRSAADLSRATRTTLLDRRTAPDAADRLVLRTSLDQLASAVPARDAASLADRLEAISKQVAERWAKRGVALNFMVIVHNSKSNFGLLSHVFDQVRKIVNKLE